MTSTRSDSNDGVGPSHDQFLQTVRHEINSLVQNDPILNDLDVDNLPAEDLENLVALHHGGAMYLKVIRGDDSVLPLIVHRDATLRHLRRQIKAATVKELQSNKDEKKRISPSPDRISWKYVWKTYGLQFEGLLFDDLDLKLNDVGIRNGSSLVFVKLKRRKK